MAFPHLSQLAAKYRDRGLVVVGINMETDSPQVRAFVAQQGPKMDYTVAADGGGAAAQALMGAAGVSGIPHAFIVGEAEPAWGLPRLLWAAWRWHGGCMAVPPPLR